MTRLLPVSLADSSFDLGLFCQIGLEPFKNDLNTVQSCMKQKSSAFKTCAIVFKLSQPHYTGPSTKIQLITIKF
jgi:hypothetical protein